MPGKVRIVVSLGHPVGMPPVVIGEATAMNDGKLSCGDVRFDCVLGREFLGTYAGIKRGEFETFMQVISPWEREFLLLNV